MPNTASASKRLRQDKVRQARNKAIKNQGMKELKVGEDVPFEQAYEFHKNQTIQNIFLE